MTITEIKNLTKYLTEEEIDSIKEEIKSKEDILKAGNIEETEMVQVLNTLFAILVIEKTLESQIEEIEDIRGELEEELIEAYKVYDSYMERAKKEKKEKKKRRWLLDLLGLSEDIRSKKEGIGTTNKALNEMQSELNKLKREKSNENLSKIIDKRNVSKRESFFDKPQGLENPITKCEVCKDKVDYRPRRERVPNQHKPHESHKHHEHHEHREQPKTSRKDVSPLGQERKLDKPTTEVKSGFSFEKKIMR